MGLDTSHGCFHGPYSSFDRFRRAVAKAAGIPADLCEGWYAAPKYEPLSVIDGTPVDSFPIMGNAEPAWWITVVAPLLPLRWDQLRPDPLIVLLDHSDCEGEIGVDDEVPLAQRLLDIASRLGPGHKEQAEAFAHGLLAANAAREPVVFG